MSINQWKTDPIIRYDCATRKSNVGQFLIQIIHIAGFGNVTLKISVHLYIDVKNDTAQMEHEATTSNIGEDQLFYCNQRGIGTEEAIALIVNGYCKDVLNQLPMEFAVEAKKLLEISLEGSVG